MTCLLRSILNAGRCAATVSSGGIAVKSGGRIGEAAIYGSGCWAENVQNSGPAFLLFFLLPHASRKQGRHMFVQLVTPAWGRGICQVGVRALAVLVLGWSWHISTHLCLVVDITRIPAGTGNLATACSVTGVGENIIKAGVAKAACQQILGGSEMSAACTDTITSSILNKIPLVCLISCLQSRVLVHNHRRCWKAVPLLFRVATPRDNQMRV